MGTYPTYDVIVIGGSYAGLSAAMALGRSLRPTLVIDGGKPCNVQTPFSHNFLTQDGKAPKEIAALAMHQVRKYDNVEVIDGFAITITPCKHGFSVSIASGDVFEGQKIILATGIKDIIPEIPGFQECWGISIIHCPYCHGYEYRHKKTAIIASAKKALHLTPLLTNLTDDLTILGDEVSNFTKEEVEILQKHGVKMVNQKIMSIEHKNGHLHEVILDNGDHMSFAAIYAGIPFEQSTDIPKLLGCELTDNGFIKTDSFQKTTVPGVFACGDNCVPMRSVAQAVASGNAAGAIANMELSQESF
ncbi:NAD(P)/FAD-dependent oxidoreductase [Allomuricauda sp. F6463D]|uniref:NAD(P)/FAD-dependent oxidoreductase n=1 Tax=Allomuricauda sp. F6463D TaxID=2926409 RepID=UPI001FF3EC10|nr:NAD(P)/FAD-dependent oxidoreductase [Muricauda sp. F6463D]MCK0160008.1 NAD(P)/FAD-dependent oxidoreductase [Muricauda sp. F6463D]